MSQFFSQINYWAILVAAIVFWLVGWIWFSGLFGKYWSKGLEKYGIKGAKLSGRELFDKCLFTFILHILTGFGIAAIVYWTGIATWGEAATLGLVLGILFSAITLCISHIWERRPALLSLIDMGYPIIGTFLATLILALWR